MTETFHPAWWLPGPHLQTVWGRFARRGPVVLTRLERLDTPDGDFVELHHIDAPPGSPQDVPLLVLLHGLEGGIRSHYIRGLLDDASLRGWRATAMVFRSCGEELNQTRRFYHSGDTADLSLVIDTLARRHPQAPIVLAGASLGGNVLLKYLGERGESAPAAVRAAVAISVPFDLALSSRHINRGFARVYQRHFLRSLRRKAMAKLGRFPDLCAADLVSSARTIYDFDDVFTAPVHGFANAAEYYARSSSIRWLSTIRVTTLLLSAVDDPFLPSRVLTDVTRIARKNPALHLEFTERGGHVGFVGGRTPLRPDYYLERRTGDFLARHLPPPRRASTPTPRYSNDQAERA